MSAILTVYHVVKLDAELWRRGDSGILRPKLLAYYSDLIHQGHTQLQSRQTARKEKPEKDDEKLVANKLIKLRGAVIEAPDLASAVVRGAEIVADELLRILHDHKTSDWTYHKRQSADQIIRYVFDALKYVSRIAFEKPQGGPSAAWKTSGWQTTRRELFARLNRLYEDVHATNRYRRDTQNLTGKHFAGFQRLVAIIYLATHQEGSESSPTERGPAFAEYNIGREIDFLSAKVARYSRPERPALLPYPQAPSQLAAPSPRMFKYASSFFGSHSPPGVHKVKLESLGKDHVLKLAGHEHEAYVTSRMAVRYNL